MQPIISTQTNHCELCEAARLKECDQCREARSGRVVVAYALIALIFLAGGILLGLMTK